MLLWLMDYLTQYHSGFGVFQYLTLRVILGVLTALMISFVIGPVMIRHLSFRQIGQQVRAPLLELQGPTVVQGIAFTNAGQRPNLIAVSLEGDAVVRGCLLGRGNEGFAVGAWITGTFVSFGNRFVAFHQNLTHFRPPSVFVLPLQFQSP